MPGIIVSVADAGQSVSSLSYECHLQLSAWVHNLPQQQQNLNRRQQADLQEVQEEG